MTSYQKEFVNTLKDIMFLTANIESPVDRVRVLQWAKRLRFMDCSDVNASRIRNEYAHFLRIMLMAKPVYFTIPFRDKPPMLGEHLDPLAEVLTNDMAKKCPDIARTGPIRPVLLHKSTDSRAFMTVQRLPEGGLMCYMAVSPKPLDASWGSRKSSDA